MPYSVVIAAYNEAANIGVVLEALLALDPLPEIIVVDDGSTDDTVRVVSGYPQARLVQNEENVGQFESIVNGVQAASHKIIVTMDADGQHPVAALKSLVDPVVQGEADLTLGVRKNLPRISETIIAFAAGVSDATTGFRAFRKELVQFFHDDYAYGGFLIRRSAQKGYRIVEIPIEIHPRLSGSSAHSNVKMFIKSIRFLLWSHRV